MAKSAEEMAAASQPTIEQSRQAFAEIVDELSRFDSFNHLRSSQFNLISGQVYRQLIGRDADARGDSTSSG